MTRGFPSRPVFSAALVLALLASVSLTAFTAPVNGAPDQETASSSVTFTHAIVNDGPEARFGFSVLDQAGTTVVKAQTTPAAGTALTQGVPATFQLTVGNFQNALVAGSNLVADVVWPNFTVISASSAGGATGPAGTACAFTNGTNGVTAGTGVGLTPPAGSTSIICTVAAGATGQTFAQVNVVVVPNIGGAIGLQTADQACALNGTTATLCEAPFQVTVQNNTNLATNTPTPTPTNTTTATATPTRTNTPTLPPPPTVATPTTAGQACNTSGSCTVTFGSAGTCVVQVPGNQISCNLTAPAGTGGGIPQVTIQTLNNPQGEQVSSCTASAGAGGVFTCTGTLSSAPISGATSNQLILPNVTPGGAPVVTLGTTNTSTTGGTVNTSLAITAAQGTAGFLPGTTGVPCATTGSAIQGGLIGGGIGGSIGGFNPIGPAGGIGFNPLGPVGGFNGGLGLAGASLGAQAGGQCQVTGTVTGTFTNSGVGIGGGQTFSLTTAVPAGIGAGAVPVAVISTTTGIVGVACTAIAIGTTTATCNGTVTGPALQGSTVAICFPNAAVTAYTCSLGTVIGPGPAILNNPLPLLPPPPLQFIPPPPPPLLPPPPPAPMGGMMAPSPMASVPVIPEADSIFLVVGGLVAVGAIAGLRSLRRRRDDEV